MVSVFPAPVLRWVVAPRPDPRRGAAGSPSRLGAPAARSRRCWCSAARAPRRRARASSVPPLDRALRSRRRSPAWPRRSTPSPPRCAPAAPSWCTATTTWTASAPRRCSPGRSGRPARTWSASCRTGCATATTSGPPGSPRPRRAGASLVITCDCGITAVDTVRAARAAGHRRGRHRPPPARRRAAAGARRRRSAARRRHLRPRERSAAPASPSSWCRRWCPRSGCRRTCPTTCSTWWPSPRWPTSCRSRARTASWCATGSGCWPTAAGRASGRWSRPRGLGGKEIRAGHLGFMLGPRLNAAGRIGDAADGLRLLLTRRSRPRRSTLARRLEGLNVERQSLDQRILEEALEQVEQAGDPERDAGFVLAGDGWHPGVVGIVASRVVERYGRPAFLIAFDGDIGKGSRPEHLALRPPRGAARLRRPAGALRRPPHGRRASPSGGSSSTRSASGSAASPARRSRPDDLGPEQRVDLELGLREATHELERLCRHLEPCGTGQREPGVRRAGRAARRPRAGRATGTSRACSTTARPRLAAIGFQWADRVPWLGDGLVDAAFRLECNEWNGHATLQARLCALAPHGGRRDAGAPQRAWSPERATWSCQPRR